MIRSLLAGAALASFVVSGALAQDVTLRIQTHHSPESISGQAIGQFYDDIEVMSGGRIAVEPFYASAVVKSTETFDASINGILDGDMTSGAYQTGKDTAFQFIGDPMGGYDTPWQMYAWLYEGGGLEAAQKLYNDLGMQLIGWHIAAPESLASTTSIGNPEDLKGWKFRSPPGMETQIFANMGASPIVMDFTEVFTSLESGIISGADMSNLAVNKSSGLYDIAKYASFPGFHSMPADHFAINKSVWDGMPEDLQRIIEVAMQKMSFRLSLSGSVATQKAAQELAAEGVTIQDWSPEDRAIFREASLKAWDQFADSDAARELIQMHKDFQKTIGLTNAQ
ncbi:TRAP transporter substrate-binding protein [Acuticoccus yangtzensis]|uniref:TRAP transporter substrate-binding protein n=1 Tax=Acuticoccus yangtzensis TaxID=1443441 RepID=UPI0009494E8D|nr:TRAP transporter substrate-binding protein [Acuticoccus yangtzensis]ORE91315.1 TRAP dicarboxylate transporter subunit DctP [Stappia sp. 22II-S9-Z10]